MSEALTQYEADIYDRQIRLWGINSQRKLRQAKVLMLNFNGVASEVAKILVLAGIDSLTIIDNQPLQSDDKTSNLFCRPSKEAGIEQEKYRTHAVVDKLKVLNPLVKVTVKNISIEEVSSQELKRFDLVTLHSFLPVNQTDKINAQCRKHGIKFYIALDFGFFGFVFSDLGSSYSFFVEKSKIEENGQIELEGGNSESESIPIDATMTDKSEIIVHDLPKKRPRLDSSEKDQHDSTPLEQIAQDQTKEEQQVISFIPFSKAISIEQESLPEKTSPILIIVSAMYKFLNEHSRLPKPNESETDKKALNIIIEGLVPSEKHRAKIFKTIETDWCENMDGSLSPVCAVLGGVAGQDMIRSLSNKDYPLHNMFTFDGLNMVGIVSKINLDDINSKSSKTATILEPVDIDLDD